MTTATPHSLPSLNIDGFRFEHLHIAPLVEGAGGPPESGPPVAIEYDLFSHPEDRRRFAVGLRIVAWIESGDTKDAARLTYEVHVGALGFLTASEELPGEDLPLPVAVNGLALLYGIIRGVLTTAGSWFDAPTLLPTVNFSRMVRERAEPAAPDAAPAATPRKRRRKLAVSTMK